jgi:hypothetical protein
MKRVAVPFLIFGLAFVTFFTACQKEEEEEKHPLVGTWEMNNMDVTSLYTAAMDIPTLGIQTGDTLGGGTKQWSFFRDTVGVNGTLVLKSDNTFTLSGKFPQSNDTLGFLPSVLSLSDQGTWSTNAENTDFNIDGAVYDISGTLTLNDPNNPTQMDVSYSEAEVDTVVLPVDANQDGIPDLYVDNVTVNNYSSTKLGFKFISE